MTASWAFALWRPDGWTVRASGLPSAVVDLPREAGLAAVIAASGLPAPYADAATWEETPGFAYWTPEAPGRLIPTRTVVAVPVATARFAEGAWTIRAYVRGFWRSWTGAGGFADTLASAGLPADLSALGSWEQIAAGEWRHRRTTWD